MSGRVMMLRISAALAILVGLLLAYKTAMGISAAYRFPLEGQESYVAWHFALQCAFAAASLGGGMLALWLSWRTLLATSWGIILGLTAPHLIRPALTIGMARQMAESHGATIGPDIGEIVLVVIALIGLVLCAASELRRASTNSAH